MADETKKLFERIIDKACYDAALKRILAFRGALQWNFPFLCRIF